MTSCPRCQGSGWVCETHRTQPIRHLLEEGTECGDAGSPCEEPGCPFRTQLTSADLARKQTSRKPYVKGKTEVGTTIAWIFALTLIGAMIWMAVTGNWICCDPDSLLVRLWRASP
jgi:hypothetical protein